MYRFLITLMLTSLFSGFVGAQEVENKKKVDTDTYKLYVEKDWYKLIDAGEEAFKKGIDFYYLRMRIAMAYYYTGSYRRAEKHFRKAEEIGYKNDIADEFIYYSLIYAGRSDDAKLWGENISVGMKKKLGLDRKTFFNTFGFSNTYSFNPESYDTPIDNVSSTDGWRNITKNYNLFSINAGNQIGKGVKINYQFSRLDKENFYYYNDESADILDKSRKVEQNQFYISFSVRPSLGFELFFGGHYVNIKVNKKSFTLSQANQANQGNSNGNENGNVNNIDIASSASTIDERLFFLGLSKESGAFSSEFAAYFSNFNNNTQSQFDLSIRYYPLGNLNLYTNSIFSLYNDKGGYENRNGMVFNQKIGFMVSKYLWMEAFTSLGEMNNFVVNRGTGIFNGLEMVKNYSGVNIIIPFIKSGAKIFITYSFYKNESLFTDTNAQKVINPINFNTHSITGGVQWNF